MQGFLETTSGNFRELEPTHSPLLLAVLLAVKTPYFSTKGDGREPTLASPMPDCLSDWQWARAATKTASGLHHAVTRAASAAGLLNQDALIEQNFDVPQGGVPRTLGQFGIF